MFELNDFNKSNHAVVAILRGIKPSEIELVCDALIRAGITMIEVPLNSPEPYESIGLAVNQFGEQAIIGAGTVLGVDQVCLLYTSPSPRDQRGSRMPSSA